MSINYTCAEDGQSWSQPLADVTEVGTLICPECGEDMDLIGATVDLTIAGLALPK